MFSVFFLPLRVSVVLFLEVYLPPRHGEHREGPLGDLKYDTTSHWNSLTLSQKYGYIPAVSDVPKVLLHCTVLSHLPPDRN